MDQLFFRGCANVCVRVVLFRHLWAGNDPSSYLLLLQYDELFESAGSDPHASAGEGRLSLVVSEFLMSVRGALLRGLCVGIHEALDSLKLATALRRHRIRLVAVPIASFDVWRSTWSRVERSRNSPALRHERSVLP